MPNALSIRFKLATDCKVFKIYSTCIVPTLLRSKSMHVNEVFIVLGLHFIPKSEMLDGSSNVTMIKISSMHQSMNISVFCIVNNLRKTSHVQETIEGLKFVKNLLKMYSSMDGQVIESLQICTTVYTAVCVLCSNFYCW